MSGRAPREPGKRGSNTVAAPAGTKRALMEAAAAAAAAARAAEAEEAARALETENEGLAAAEEPVAAKLPVLKKVGSTPKQLKLILRDWATRNGILQNSCGKEFAEHISLAIPHSDLQPNLRGYYIHFNIGPHNAHISFHKEPGEQRRAGAFHLKFDDETLTVRLVLERRPDDVLQFFPVVTKPFDELPDELIPEIENKILEIVGNINERLSENGFTGNPAHGCGGGGGGRAYIPNEGSFPPLGKKPRWGGGTRKNRSRRHKSKTYKRQQKKRYTRRSN